MSLCRNVLRHWFGGRFNILCAGMLMGIAPRLRCFVHVDFEMCCAPQRHALFRHLNFQKSSERAVFFVFSLPNVLRATTPSTFSASQLLKVVRRWCVLCILTRKCGLKGVQLIWPHGSAPAALASLLFDPPEPQIIGKTQWIATTFSRTCIFCLLTLSLFCSSLFYSSLLSDSSHLCFSSVHIVGSFPSKLPSNKDIFWSMTRYTEGILQINQRYILCKIHGMLKINSMDFNGTLQVY